MNPAACRRLGYSREELLQMTTRDVDDPDFASGFEDRVKEQMAMGRLSCEGCHVAKDGRRIPVDINTSIVHIDGKPAVLAVMRDISARKAAERRQAAQHAVTRALAEAATIEAAAPEVLRALGERLGWEGAAFWIIAPGADVLSCLAVWHCGSEDAAALAAAARPLTFARGQGAPGRVWQAGEPIWFPDVTRVETSPRAALAARTGARQVFGFPIRSGEEIRGVVGLFGRNLPDPDGELVALVISVGSQLGLFIERRRAEEAQQQMQAVLIRSEKLASIGLLSAGVAHEINNPLAYVANNLVVLERDMKGLQDVLDLYEGARARLAEVDAETAAKIAAIADQIDLDYIRGNLGRILSKSREGVDRMARIVQGLRSLARTDHPRMEETRVGELIESSVEMARGRIHRRGIRMEVNLDKLPAIRCVSTQIGQVILNLLVNAAQAIEAGPGPATGLITISGRRVDDMVHLEIADNGCGIDPNELPRIFDPFYTSKPVGEGTGLGLSITHNIVTGHGGHIDVDSRPGVGTTFRIALPIQPRGTP
jgi:PAS domain S-box-containing protein